MTEQERYEQVDLPFYHREVAPALPAEVLDFHVHVWTSAHLRQVPWETGEAGADYMVVETDYGTERLIADGKSLFPDRPFNAVVFGNPTPAADHAKTHAYLAQTSAQRGLFPLFVAGRDLLPRETLERMVREEGFFGYKVFLNWFGDNYGDLTMEQMLGPTEMEVANELGLVVLWHVPRAKRLADPVVQQGVRDYAHRYPNARIVLAHCGRCYLPDEMQAAVHSVADLDNVYLDTAMVMDPTVLQIVFDHLDASRVLFATDLPVAAMRGRRVYVMDHWVDVVLEGYPKSAYRLASNGIRATFMAYEIVLAIRRAAELARLTAQQTQSIYFANGLAVLRHVLGGRQLEAVRRRWAQGSAA